MSEPLPPLTTREAIEQFVIDALSSPGTYFRSMSKTDIYGIAQFIDEQKRTIERLRLTQVPPTDEQGETPADDTPQNPPETPVDASQPETGADTAPCEGTPQTPPEMPQTQESAPVQSAPCLTVREWMEAQGMDAQAAYDMYLKWARDNHMQTTVMDFGNGQEARSAAFAYWLTCPKAAYLDEKPQTEF